MTRVDIVTDKDLGPRAIRPPRPLSILESGGHISHHVPTLTANRLSSTIPTYWVLSWPETHASACEAYTRWEFF